MDTLITIPLSHYCERARWALDHCGVPYREEPHLQMFSSRRTKKVGASRRVPVLVTQEGVLDASEKIVRYADARAPQGRRLYPAGEGEEVARRRAAIDDWESRLSDRFGVEVRKAAYWGLLEDTKLLLRYNNQTAPWHERALLTLSVGRARKILVDYLGLSADATREAEAFVFETFDAVAKALEENGGWLVAGGFSAADLTFASLSTVILWPAEHPLKVPTVDELPASAGQMVERFRGHAAGAHALRVYRELRGASTRSLRG